jgi:lipid A 3-O-deacylase
MLGLLYMPLLVLFASTLLILSANAGSQGSPGSGSSSAQLETPSASGELTNIIENATFSPFGRDRHYTSGVELAYTTGSLLDNDLRIAPMRWLSRCSFLFHTPGPDTDNRAEWTILGQNLFTPEDHRTSNPGLNDRPYAGWLYTGLNFIQNVDNHQLTALRILGGVVGPWAFGRQTQNDFHSLFDIRPAKGWGHQLGNEPGFTIAWERKWRFNRELGSGYSWELIPDAGITVGNVYDFAEIGLLARWGCGLKANWGPEFIHPGYSGTSYFSGDLAGVKVGWDFFLGTQGRLIARNIFLDGNTFQNSRSVDKIPAVADIFVGTEIFTRNGFRLGFSMMARTPEFKKQRAMDGYGSINALYVF